MIEVVARYKCCGWWRLINPKNCCSRSWWCILVHRVVCSDVVIIGRRRRRRSRVLGLLLQHIQQLISVYWSRISVIFNMIQKIYARVVQVVVIVLHGRGCCCLTLLSDELCRRLWRKLMFLCFARWYELFWATLKGRDRVRTRGISEQKKVDIGRDVIVPFAVERNRRATKWGYRPNDTWYSSVTSPMKMSRFRNLSSPVLWKYCSSSECKWLYKSGNREAFVSRTTHTFRRIYLRRRSQSGRWPSLPNQATSSNKTSRRNTDCQRLRLTSECWCCLSRIELAGREARGTFTDRVTGDCDRPTATTTSWWDNLQLRF